VPRHVARLVVDYSTSRRLVFDNSASRRLVVDNFASAARPGASARRAARHADRRAARRRLLRLRRVSGCLGTSRDSSLVVDYFAYSTRPSATARLVAHHGARRATRRRLLRLRRASGCLGTSRGSSRRSSHRSSSTTPRRVGSSSTTPPRLGSSSTTPPRAGSSLTTSPPPRVWVARHVARLVTRLVVDYSASHRLVVDYFASTMRPGASARRAARHADRRAARRRLCCGESRSFRSRTMRGDKSSRTKTKTKTQDERQPKALYSTVDFSKVDPLYKCRSVSFYREAGGLFTFREHPRVKRIRIECARLSSGNLQLGLHVIGAS
jgi:hypothetical protein